MAYREIDPSRLAGREPYFLITSLVVPRPIAWVSSISPQGIVNLAPHSYFNIVSSNPWIVHFTSTGQKDTLHNVRATGEFVVNLVGRGLAEQMNRTSAELPPDLSEVEEAGLKTLASKYVHVPRIAGAPAALECRVNEIISKGNGYMVFGDVLLAHVDDALFRNGRIDPVAWRPIGRLGGSSYTDAAGAMFKLERPRRNGGSS